MLLLNMQSEIPWERMCKTCNTCFVSERCCRVHIQEHKSHKLETKKEANDRIFKTLVSSFTNSLPKSKKTGSPASPTLLWEAPNGPEAKKQGFSTSPAKKRKNLVFASTNTVSSAIYKDNYRATQDLVFISDDQESFEPIYGPLNPESCTPPQTSSPPRRSFQQTAPPATPRSSSYSGSSLPRGSITRPNTGSSSVATSLNSRPNTGRSVSSLVHHDNEPYYAPKSYFPVSQQFLLLQLKQASYKESPASLPPGIFHPAAQNLPSLAPNPYPLPAQPPLQPLALYSPYQSPTAHSPVLGMAKSHAKSLAPSHASEPITLPSIRQIFPESGFFQYETQDNAREPHNHSSHPPNYYDYTKK